MSMKIHTGSDGTSRGYDVGSGNRAAAGAEMRELHRRLSAALRHQRVCRGRSGGLDPAGSRTARKASKRPRRRGRCSRRSCTERGVPQSSRPGAGLSCGWLDDAPEGESFVGSYGRVFDITVLGRPDANTIGLHNRAIESGLFESGRPILLAPPVPPKQIATNIMVALELQHRAGARSGFAMPLLHQAAQVTVLNVTGGPAVPGPVGRAVAQHLQLNGIAAKLKTVGLEGRAPARRSCARRRPKAAISWSRAHSPRAGCGR